MDTETIIDRKRLDRMHAEAIKFLIDHADFDLAVTLARARLTRIEADYLRIVDPPFQQLNIYLTAETDDRPKLEVAADAMVDEKGEYAGPGALVFAFGSVTDLEDLGLWPTLHVAAPEREVGRHQGTAREPGKYEHRGIRYRSRTEIRVAEALDEANVLYFPLPLGVRHYVRLAEPDFLVVHLGRVGILEIDGPTHTPLTRAQESAKDAKLLQSGVRYIHHADVREVDKDAAAVVQNFLAMLRGPIL